MALLTTQKLTKAGGLSYAAATAAGDTVDADGAGLIVHARNAHATIVRTITIAAVTDPIDTAQAGSLAVPDIVIVVAALSDDMFTIPQSHISAGMASTTYDTEADLTLAALRAG